MKPILVATVILAAPATAGDFPPPMHTIADCENSWFLLKGDDPNLRKLGVAYVDPTAGVTYEHNGEVVMSDNGALVRKPPDWEGKARLIVRVESNFDVACLSPEQVSGLGLDPVPDFLEWYKDKREPGTHNVSWASHYNHIGAYVRAFEFLRLARESGHESLELHFEHSFALNATSQFPEAIEVLDRALKTYADDPDLHGELAYAHLKLSAYQRAIDVYRVAITKFETEGTGRSAEFAQNISVAYRQLGDQKSAQEWLAKAKAWKERKDE